MPPATYRLLADVARGTGTREHTTEFFRWRVLMCRNLEEDHYLAPKDKLPSGSPRRALDSRRLPPAADLEKDAPSVIKVKRISADDLDDRQIRGVLRSRVADRSNAMVIPINDSTTLWMSKRGNRAWMVEREYRNRRDERVIEYRCGCSDFQKNGRIDCEHIFAERIRRSEIIIDGTIERKRVQGARAARRPARKRIGADGRSHRSIQRDARVAIPERVPELLYDLSRAMVRSQ
jgi:hypothetical protein